MNKLCCLPFADNPDVNVKVNCVASCCASEITDSVKENHCVKHNENNDDVDSQSVKTNKFCFCCKKRSHAKEKEVVANFKHERNAK